MKKIKTIILSLILILLTTGCTKADMAINIRADQTVTIGYNFLVEQEYAAQLTKDSFGGLIKGFDQAKTTLIDYEEGNKKYSGYRIILDRMTFEEFESLGTGFVIETDGETYLFKTNPNVANPLQEEMRRRINDAVAKANLTDDATREEYRQKLTNSIHYQLTVSMPGTVTESNGKELSGSGLYAWEDFFGSDVYIRSTTKETNILLPTNSKMGLYLAIGGLSTVFLGMLVFLISAMAKVKKETN